MIAAPLAAPLPPGYRLVYSYRLDASFDALFGAPGRMHLTQRPVSILMHYLVHVDACIKYLMHASNSSFLFI